MEIRERPIIFKSEMVKAILEGRKTMTRKPLKIQPSHKFAIFADYKTDLGFNKSKESFWVGFWLNGSSDAGSPGYFKCPYGQPGDRLWVRENFWTPPKEEESSKFGIQYDADATQADLVNAKRDLLPLGWKHHPSIFMAKRFSRITLEITNIRVERVQEITEEDAIKEGIIKKEGYGDAGLLTGYFPGNCEEARIAFGVLWDSIYGKEIWERNDWVWAIEFKSITCVGDK